MIGQDIRDLTATKQPLVRKYRKPPYWCFPVNKDYSASGLKFLFQDKIVLVSEIMLGFFSTTEGKYWYELATHQRRCFCIKEINAH